MGSLAASSRTICSPASAWARPVWVRELLFRMVGSKGLKQPLAAFVRLAEPIPFESPDGQPVGLLIFLLVPEQATQQHLEILSEIAQLLSDRDARDHLNTEPDALSIHLVPDTRSGNPDSIPAARDSRFLARFSAPLSAWFSAAFSAPFSVVQE